MSVKFAVVHRMIDRCGDSAQVVGKNCRNNMVGYIEFRFSEFYQPSRNVYTLGTFFFVPVPVQFRVQGLGVKSRCVAG